LTKRAAAIAYYLESSLTREPATAWYGGFEWGFLAPVIRLASSFERGIVMCRQRTVLDLQIFNPRVVSVQIQRTD
jgi:hypothetical protein